MTGADILFFAILAGFILYKLYTILGKDDFNQPTKKKRKDSNGFLVRKNDASSQDKVVNFPSAKQEPQRPQETTLDKRRKIKEPEITNVSLVKQIDKIKNIDLSFSPGMFLEGAKQAFEMVITAFSKGDKNTLRSLLYTDVYNIFSDEIEKREAAKQIYETTLISIDSAEITDVEIKGNHALVTVDFISNQVLLIKDEAGNVIDGDPADVEEMEDQWVFKRDLTSSNPNWVIIST